MKTNPICDRKKFWLQIFETEQLEIEYQEQFFLSLIKKNKTLIYMAKLSEASKIQATLKVDFD